MNYKNSQRKTALYVLVIFQLGTSSLWADGGILNWLEKKSEVDIKVQLQPSAKTQDDPCAAMSMKSSPGKLNTCYSCPEGTQEVSDIASLGANDPLCTGTPHLLPCPVGVKKLERSACQYCLSGTKYNGTDCR